MPGINLLSLDVEESWKSLGLVWFPITPMNMCMGTGTSALCTDTSEPHVLPLCLSVFIVLTGM